MNFRNLKRSLKRGVKSAHKNGAVIDFYGTDVSRKNSSETFELTKRAPQLCLVASNVVGHKSTHKSIYDALAEKLGLNTNDVFALEHGFLYCDWPSFEDFANEWGDGYNKKYMKVGFDLGLELRKEGVYKS